MATTNLGRVRFRPRGDYNPAADPLYSLLDLVSDGGGSFVYINDTPSNEPTSSTSHWQQIASVGGQDLVDAAVEAKNTAVSAKDTAVAAAAQLQAGIGSPAGKFANLAAVNAANPSHDRTYLTEDDWKIALWDEIAQVFVAGGVYQAASITDGSVTEPKTSFFTRVLSANKADYANYELKENNYAITFPIYLEPSTNYKLGYKSNISNCKAVVKNSAGSTLLTIVNYNYVNITGAPFSTDATYTDDIYYLYVNFTTNDAPTYATDEWLVIVNDGHMLSAVDYVAFSLTYTLTNKVGTCAVADALAYYYNGKVLATYGDSVTAQGLWQGDVMRKLGFSTHNNYGTGGMRLMTMAMSATIASTIVGDFDILLVMGGINDWADDRPIGTIADMNTDTEGFLGTFYGGVRLLMKNLTTSYPTKRILFLTPTPCNLAAADDFFSHSGSPDGYINSNGDTIQDFAAVVVECGKEFGVPVLDLCSAVGWNIYNRASYLTNETGNYIHPNTLGGKRIAELVVGKLREIEPIS